MFFRDGVHRGFPECRNDSPAAAIGFDVSIQEALMRVFPKGGAIKVIRIFNMHAAPRVPLHHLLLPGRAPRCPSK